MKEKLEILLCFAIIALCGYGAFATTIVVANGLFPLVWAIIHNVILSWLASCIIGVCVGAAAFVALLFVFVAIWEFLNV